MPDGHAGPRLRGRRLECEALDRLLAGVRAGQSQVLVLRGEAGVGKTALLDYVQERSSGCRVARAAGVESEMELAFAGLHQLCAPMLGTPGRTCPNRSTPRSARRSACVAGRRPIGSSSVWRCSGCCRRWPASSRSSAWSTTPSGSIGPRRRRSPSRRAGSWPSRWRWCSWCGSPATSTTLAGLPEMVVRGLRDGDARALLDAVTPGRLDERVRDRIIAETRGNPLALLELPRGLSAAELAGGFGRPDAQPLASRIEQSFMRRLESLPAATQTLLLTAASEPVGDVTLLWRAAEELGIGPGCRRPGRDRRADRAGRAGAVPSSAGARRGLPGGDGARPPGGAPRAGRGDRSRRPTPTAGPGTGPTRRQGPDEEVAAELERSAPRAQARGGVAAAAAFLERATELTADPGPAGTAGARGRPGEARRRLARRRIGAGGDRGAVPARRARPRQAGPAAGTDRVRPPARERRPAAAVRGGEAPRAPRRRAGARDVPRGARGGDLRRSPRQRARAWWRWPRPPGRRRPRRRAGVAAAAGGRPAPRRRGVPLHRGLRRGGPSPPACAGGRPAGGGHPLVLAGLPHRVGAVGRRDLGGAGRPPGPDRPRDRRPRRPAPRAHLPLGHAPARRRVRRHRRR